MPTPTELRACTVKVYTVPLLSSHYSMIALLLMDAQWNPRGWHCRVSDVPSAPFAIGMSERIVAEALPGYRQQTQAHWHLCCHSSVVHDTQKLIHRQPMHPVVPADDSFCFQQPVVYRKRQPILPLRFAGTGPGLSSTDSAP